MRPEPSRRQELKNERKEGRKREEKEEKQEKAREERKGGLASAFPGGNPSLSEV
jgi:hypothetical protein